MDKRLYKIYLYNIAIYLTIAIFFITDRYLKGLAANGYFQSPKEIIQNIFYLSFTANYNIAFSLPLSGMILNAIVITIILIILIGIIYLFTKRPPEKTNAILLTVILFGAISNMIDRLTVGYVIDYLYLKHFTIFNVADIMISLGTILLIINNINKKKKA